MIKYNALESDNYTMLYGLLILFGLTRAANGVLRPVIDYLIMKMMMTVRLAVDSAVFAKSLKMSLLS